MADNSPLRFSHMVYFSLKDASESACTALVSACQEHLSGHSGTVFFAAGILADTSRAVNDRDFDVALHLVFDNKAAHDAYQAADRHQVFIDQNKDNWSRVRVFDAYVH